MVIAASLNTSRWRVGWPYFFTKKGWWYPRGNVRGLAGRRAYPAVPRNSKLTEEDEEAQVVRLSLYINVTLCPEVWIVAAAAGSRTVLIFRKCSSASYLCSIGQEMDAEAADTIDLIEMMSSR